MGWRGRGVAAIVTMLAMAGCEGVQTPQPVSPRPPPPRASTPDVPSSTDGARIVFSRRTGVGNQEFLGLFSIALDGTGEAPFLAEAAGPDAHLEAAGFSPDGAKVSVVMVRGDRTGTIVMNTDGTGERRFGLGRPDGFALVCDRWSPDGARLACAGLFDPERTGVYTVRPDGTDLVRVTDVPEELQPVHFDLPCGFSPDGQRIAFHRMDIERLAGDGDLFVVGTDGTGERLVSDVGVDFGCAWSPAGDRLVAGGTGDLYLIDLDGTVTTIPRPAEIVNTFAPSFSPDGSSIVFTGWTEGAEQPDIYVMNVDGSGLVQLTDTPDAKEEMAVWAPPGAG